MGGMSQVRSSYGASPTLISNLALTDTVISTYDFQGVSKPYGTHGCNVTSYLDTALYAPLCHAMFSNNVTVQYMSVSKFMYTNIFCNPNRFKF